MHVSSRWCVTAVLAFGALACSDPVPPPAQGAFLAHVKSPSPLPEGKQCRIGGAFTYDIPVIFATKPLEQLDADTYLHKAVDGEKGASVSCSVKGSSTFSFSGEYTQGDSLSLSISSGTIGADGKGTALISIYNSTKLSTALTSPGATCTIDAAKGANNNFQVKPGSMWAAFNCAAVDAPPSDSCSADGFFVLENCDQ
jgi:hypothetical protein